MKEGSKTPEGELNKTETSGLLDGEFKTLVMTMLSELSKDLNSIKKAQSEAKGTLTEMQNNLQGNSSTGVELRDSEYKEAENTQSEQQ